ncbi:hypothetical protein JCM6882_007999 [Rhodosporidiobolus microsporus]
MLGTHPSAHPQQQRPPRLSPAGALVDGWRRKQERTGPAGEAPPPPSPRAGGPPASPVRAGFGAVGQQQGQYARGGSGTAGAGAGAQANYGSSSSNGRGGGSAAAQAAGAASSSRSPRPPSGLSSQSNPSLLSLEQQPPPSPATTVDAFPPSHQHPFHPHSHQHPHPHPHPHPHLQHLPHHPANLSRYGPPPHAHLHPHPHQQQHQPHPSSYRHSQPHLSSPSHSPSSSTVTAAPLPSRSHHSLPASASASSPGASTSAASLGYAPGRHHPQMNRVYGGGKGERYDAEFDRSAGGVGATAGPSRERELFNPNGPLPPPPPPPPASASHHAHSSASPAGDPSRARSRDRKHRPAHERPSRSKRDPVDPADLGRRALVAVGVEGGRGERGKDSRESLAESVETDFSGRTKSSSGGGGASRRRRRREGGEDEGEGGEGGGEGAAAGGGKNRQLFDPRKDDPMRFTPGAGGAGLGKSGAKHDASARSLASQSVVSFASGVSDATGTGAVGEYAAHQQADDGASVITGLSAASGRTNGHSSSSGSSHPALVQIRRVYKTIQELEARCAEEGRAAAREKERREEEGEGEAGVGAKGVRMVRREGRAWDDEYWVRVAGVHKQLADAHYSFLQLSLDPRLPASLHQLPQRYNIPTRLWQVAFHQLLERMRHAVLSQPLPSSSSSTSSSAEPPSSNAGEANVLDHLIDFIHHAYTHYSQLFEDPAVAVFRAAWIEQLGDLARYRMAVAGLASRVHAAQQAALAAASPSSSALTAANLDAASRAPRPAAPAPGAGAGAGAGDAPSIGLAALDTWDLEEQETWREMAREWYAVGVAENPGTGRLQHHLALLSRGGAGGGAGGEGEVRGVYHYVKSLTAAHPYPAARESILPLFDSDAQSRRTLPDVSKPDLFVHLHGMLFTKISLDDFDDVLERFIERLREEGWHLGKGRSREEMGGGKGGKGERPFEDKDWFMLGVINVAALLQYGAEDGVLRKLMVREGGDEGGGRSGGKSAGGGGGKHGHGGHGAGHGSRKGMSPAEALAAKFRAAPPQAIMVKRDEGETGGVDGSGGGAGDGADEGDDVLKPLNHNADAASASQSPADDPLPFKLAQRLAFRLLSFVARDTNPFRRLGSATVLNPYITILLTFLAHLSHHPLAFAHVERDVPWADVVHLLNLVPSAAEGGADIRVADAPNKLVGGRPLPEDWCIRGMDWAGRQLFGRGYWREARPGGGGAGRGGEQHLPPPIEGVDAPTVRVESEMDALKFDLSALTLSDDPSSSPAASPAPSDTEHDHDSASPSTPPAAAALATGRWRRLALCGAWLVRNVPGLDFEPYPRIDLAGENGEEEEEEGRFRIAQPLKGKIARWKMEDEEEREAEIRARERVAERSGAVGGEVEDDEEESEGEDEENEEDSEAVKELKARRRALKAVIRQARQATRSSIGAAASGRGLHTKLGGKASAIPKVFAGFTVLVFDTNILLTSIKLFRELIEAECWTVVVPLAVITELDGLKRNPTALGAAAVEVIDYLELAVHSHSRYLKIQTSRGNYLKDLAIRNESIDFSHAPSSSSSDPFDADFSSPSAPSHDHARTMDDVILRAVTWQSQHFTSRLALVNPRALQAGAKVPPETAQVVLVTFDRNLRLKARARGLDATDEKGLKRAVEAAPRIPGVSAPGGG